MNPSNLKDSVRAGLARHYFDGVTEWSRKDFHALINPSGYKNSIEDPEIQAMLRNLEKEGILQVLNRNDVYFVIKQKPWDAS